MTNDDLPQRNPLDLVLIEHVQSILREARRADASTMRQVVDGLNQLDNDANNTGTAIPIIDRWLAQSQDCAADPGELPLEQAHYVLGLHAGHGPTCRQYFAASAIADPDKLPARPRDNCEVGWFAFLPNPHWARGILDQHADCTPPCPRQHAATEYLAELDEQHADTTDEGEIR